MKQYWLICISLFGYFLSNCQQHENELFLEGKYELAAVGFEHLYFLNSNNETGAYFLYKKAECYKALGQFEKAYQILGRTNFSKEDSMRSVIIREKIVLSFLSQHYQETYNQILRSKIIGIAQDREMAFYEFMSLVALNKWTEAKDYLLQKEELFGLSDADVESVFPKKLKIKNPDKAFNISVFLPGVGQAYAGYPFKGFLSGTVQVGLIAFSLYNLYYGYYFSGALTGVTLFYTFYLGGANYAEDLAVQHNNEVSKAIELRFIKLTEK